MGFEVDVRLAFGASGMHGGLLVEIALLATSLGLVVPVLAEAVVLHHPLGVLTGGMRVGGLSHRGRGAFRSESADRPCHWQADCCCSVCWVRSPGGPGCRTYRQLTALADRLADISAQIPIRLTVLLAAGIALGAQVLDSKPSSAHSLRAYSCECWTRARTGRSPSLISWKRSASAC